MIFWIKQRFELLQPFSVVSKTFFLCFSFEMIFLQLFSASPIFFLIYRCCLQKAVRSFLIELLLPTKNKLFLTFLFSHFHTASLQFLATYKCLLSGVKVEMYFPFKSRGITSGARFIFIFITPSTVLMMTLQKFLPCFPFEICFLFLHPRIGKRMCAESLSHWQNILQQKMMIPGEEIINLSEEVERSGKVNPQEKRELFIFSFIVLQVFVEKSRRAEEGWKQFEQLYEACFSMFPS